MEREKIPKFEYSDHRVIAVKQGDHFVLTAYGKQCAKEDWWKKVVDCES